MEERPATLEHLMHAFHRMHHGCMRHQFEKRGLQDVGNPAILFILRRYGDGPVTQRQIADKLGISPPTVAVSIKRMEKAGLLRKETDADDLRKNCITLTEKGKALTDESIAAEREIYHRIVEGFSPEEQETLCGYYLRMIGNMRGFGCRAPALSDALPEPPARAGTTTRENEGTVL